MPTVREIEQALFRLAPKEGAMDWDNVGQLLGDPEGLCRMGTLASPMPLQEFAKHVCRALQANGVRYAGDSGPVRKVAVGGGACGDYEDAAIAAGCDVFVTSDLSYHQL